LSELLLDDPFPEELPPDPFEPESVVVMVHAAREATVAMVAKEVRTLMAPWRSRMRAVRLFIVRACFSLRREMR